MGIDTVTLRSIEFLKRRTPANRTPLLLISFSILLSDEPMYTLLTAINTSEFATTEEFSWSLQSEYHAV